jgi:catechol 2,3-dioxygenase-like lactoylglutathione lyase family enzyme
MDGARISLLVLEVADLEASTRFYRDAMGIPLHVGADNGAGDDRWLSGEHQAVSWREGGYFHFSLYAAKGEPTEGAQIGFVVPDLAVAHARAVAARAPLVHPPRPEPWGETARYRDPDGNCVSLTQARQR